MERSRAGKALQDLTGKLLEAQEEERRRIGRELHDGLNQQLAMFAVELGLLARQAPAEATELIESILNLRQRAEGLSNDLRMITHQLHPAALEHLGLISALRSLCGEFSRHEGIRVWFSVEKEFARVPADIAICLYRIAQEALRNVVKHSGSSVAWVRIAENRGEIQLSVEDKGAGFKLHASPTAGLGLVSMQERVQIVQGKINHSVCARRGHPDSSLCTCYLEGAKKWPRKEIFESPRCCWLTIMPSLLMDSAGCCKPISNS